MIAQGAKVVCINDVFAPQIAAFYKHLPKAGVTYVVRDMAIGVSPDGEPGQVAVTLVGLVNPCSNTPPYPERAFNADRFRPLRQATAEEILAAGKGCNAQAEA